ncbi:MAG TPA: flagellin [bacterium]|nr:flagellin [bacterium]
MALRIMNNVAATFAQRQLSINSNNLSRSLEKLSSGYRINRASDDAAGLSVSERMRFQISGMQQAMKNTMDGISLAQVAEGGLQNLCSILQRMRVLSLQASNGTLSSSDRSLITEEVNQLISEIDRMQTAVSFNGVSLLGSAQSIQIQVGASAGQQISIVLSSITASGLGINTLDVSSATNAATAVSSIDSALSSVLSLRAKLGAAQNRMEKTYDYIAIQRENLMAAESRIRDVDFAEEMTNYTKNQILMQASTAMLSQANVSVQAVLQLLS